MKTHSTSIAGFVILLLAFGQNIAHAGYEVPGEMPAGAVILENAIIHTADEVIEKGRLVFEAGKITHLGKMSGEFATEGQQVDLTGKHVYPGLINADSVLGLVEIDSVRATLDYSETGSINPNVRAAVAFNPDSELIPVARAGGVLLTLTCPRGGFVRGQSSLMRLDGWTGESMTMVGSVGIHVGWPAPPRSRRGGSSDESKPTDRRKKQLDELRRLLKEARAYAALVEKNPAHPFDARLAAMTKLTSRELPMYVHANSLQLIQEAIAFAQREKLRLAIVGGYDAPKCSALLKQFDIPVIVTGTQRNPRRRQADYDEPFRVPSELEKAGVRYCLAGYERFSASLVQNLTHHAGTAVAHGLKKNEALRAITLYPAEILGVSERTGSLKVGKDATLIITDGDLLEITTHVERAWLEGRPVDLNNRHKRLWKKYQQRYPQADAGRNR